jgi:ABC-2 type transport system ATP-binding protein
MPDVAGSSGAPAGATDATSALPLRTVGLTRRFGQRVAVNNLNLEVYRGDVFGLLGPNGSGKTTTLRMALGLIKPTRGQALLFGVSPVPGPRRREVLRRVGAMIEQPAFYPYLTGRENLGVVAAFSGLRDDTAMRARIAELLAQVELGDRPRDAFRTYSMGMKQRLAIAAALLTEPELVLLDEPTNGLDPAGMVEIRQLIGRLAGQGITVLLSSHLLHEVQSVCTRVAILKQGSLVTQGRVSDLLAEREGLRLAFDDVDTLTRAAGLLHSASGTSASWLRGIRYVPAEQGSWTPAGGHFLQVDAPAEQASEVAALLAEQRIFPAEMRRQEADLETLFLELTAPGAAMPAASPAPSTSIMREGAR